MIKPAYHGFWVMLVFAVALAVLRALGDDLILQLRSSLGDVALALIIIVPAWFLLQLIARSIKVVCPRCGKSAMKFTGQFPLARRFHCDACGADHEISGPGRRDKDEE